MDIKKEYERWLMNATADADVAAELKTLDDTKIEDAFYRDLVVRPSGTEPKLKTYISVSAENKETAEKVEAEIRKSAEEYLK